MPVELMIQAVDGGVRGPLFLHEGPPMTTKLDHALKRELMIGDAAYTITLTYEGFTLALKGRRKGLEIQWADLVSGEAALATALNATLTANLQPCAGNVEARRK
jgi:hypothetical protein